MDRVQELAAQAKASVTAGLPVEEWIAEYNRIFAELIVRECVDIADEYDGVGSTIVSRIKEHFGVER